MKIHPLFKYFGSKWRTGYPAPVFDTIYEPYAGSASYSLNHAEKDVVLYDSNQETWDLWYWIIHEATAPKVMEIPVSVPLGTDIRTLGLSRGQELLMKHWQRTKNFGEWDGQVWKASVWNGTSGNWSVATRKRIAEDIYSVKHWSLSAVPLPFNVPNVTYFVDPPYQYNYQYKGGRFDYELLKSKIRGMVPPYQLICCEACHPVLGWVPDWAPFTDHRTVINSRRTYSRELIYHRVERLSMFLIDSHICPFCQAAYTSQCRCPLSNMTCPNGHQWHHHGVYIFDGAGNHDGPCPASERAIARLKT